MPICLYVDEDAMARALVRRLRARGIDVTTVLEAGMSEQNDIAQLEYATQHGHVFYTSNIWHLCHLQAQYMPKCKNHTGIIMVFRQCYPAGEQIQRLLQLISMKSAEGMRNNLQFL
jgi:uncharacterized ferritin-like protein (DUF455 family)